MMPAVPAKEREEEGKSQINATETKLDSQSEAAAAALLSRRYGGAAADAIGKAAEARNHP